MTESVTIAAISLGRESVSTLLS